MSVAILAFHCCACSRMNCSALSICPIRVSEVTLDGLGVRVLGHVRENQRVGRYLRLDAQSITGVRVLKEIRVSGKGKPDSEGGGGYKVRPGPGENAILREGRHLKPRLLAGQLCYLIGMQHRHVEHVFSDNIGDGFIDAAATDGIGCQAPDFFSQLVFQVESQLIESSVMPEEVREFLYRRARPDASPSRHRSDCREKGADCASPLNSSALRRAE